MIARIPGSDTPIGDAVTLVVWSVLAVAAVCLLWQRPSARRGAWLVITGACVLIALDKAIDVQQMGSAVLRGVARATEILFDVPPHDRRVRAGILVGGTLAALAMVAWLVRRDRPLTGGRAEALLGLMLVVVWVGLRFVPGLGWLGDPRIGWVVEALACSCLAYGLWRARRLGPDQR